jgi:hypothetical protein
VFSIGTMSVSTSVKGQNFLGTPLQEVESLEDVPGILFDFSDKKNSKHPAVRPKVIDVSSIVFYYSIKI